MNLFKRILPDIVVIILFAVISFVYFFPAVTEGRIISQHDSVAGIGAGEEAKEYLERTGEHIEGGHCGDYCHHPTHCRAILEAGSQNLIFREETGERRNTGNGETGNQECPVSNRHVFA